MVRRVAWLLVMLGGMARPSPGVILLETDDPQRNTSTPGDNSGWQYEGQFGGFLGTPVAPLFFLTATHIGDQGTFIFHGETFTPVAAHYDPNSDFVLWEVDHSFADYAPLFTGASGSEAGRELRVHGRGTQRGAERRLDGDPALRGWDWGPGDGVPRWGSNLVEDLPMFGGTAYVHATFDSPGVANEGALSAGDSGGGLFVQEDGLWKLAGINDAVDDLYTTPDNSGQIVPVLFDARGFYSKEADGTFTLIGSADPVPTGFYSTRVASRLDWIQSVTGLDPSALPTESFGAWSHLYFTPEQIADGAVNGATADPDGDGICNLLEYAFNLDPMFTAPVTMTAGTGGRGLPLVRVETVAEGDQRLTVEFVRRTAGSGSGLTYAAQFATDLAAGDWQAGGTETVTPINARWERVKVTDGVSVGGAVGRRFARVAVMQN